METVGRVYGVPDQPPQHQQNPPRKGKMQQQEQWQDEEAERHLSCFIGDWVCYIRKLCCYMALR